MAVIVIAGVVLGALAFRFPIVNALAGWLVVFPIVTVSGGSIAWVILIQRWDPLFSFLGYGLSLVAFAVPVAILVCRLTSLGKAL
jgi:hypothetical protein